MVKGDASIVIAAPPHRVWSLISDVTNVGKFSPETFEAQWLDGATGPKVGVRFRGHVRRNGKPWLVYWTTCLVTQCQPDHEFTFVVLDPWSRPTVTWSYIMEPCDEGTLVAESFHVGTSWVLRLYALVARRSRTRTNIDNMHDTLRRIKAVAESTDATH